MTREATTFRALVFCRYHNAGLFTVRDILALRWNAQLVVLSACQRRRRIRTEHRRSIPTSDWVVQQLREVFSEAGSYRYVILDYDSKFDTNVIAFLQATDLKPKRTSVEAPWQNGIADAVMAQLVRPLFSNLQ